MNSLGRARGRQLPKTSWALLEAAKGQGLDAEPAREEFARRYAPPIRAFIAALTRDPEEADELAQGFYTDVILSGRLLQRYDAARGTFRPFLKQALRNYVTSSRRARWALKRNPAGVVHPDENSAGWDAIVPAVEAAPEAAFHEAWVRALLREALTRVKAICEAKGQTEHLRIFAGRYLARSAVPPSWAELGAPFGLDGKTARSRAETVAYHLRAALAEMVARETGSGESVDEEIASLLSLF